MKSFLAVIVSAVVLVSASQSAEFYDKEHGYSIAVPELGRPPVGLSMTRLMSQGPAEEGFSANLNLQVQNVQISRDDYIALSDKQMADGKMKILNKQLLDVAGRPAVMYELSWTLGGIDLRVLSLAVIRPNDVILVTCTDRAASFAKNEAEFRKAINSIKLAP